MLSLLSDKSVLSKRVCSCLLVRKLHLHGNVGLSGKSENEEESTLQTLFLVQAKIQFQ